MAGGRPTKFTKQIQKQIKSLVLLGLTDQQVADGIGVDQSTLTNWKKKYPKFFASLKDWKDEADRKVEKSLYERACGFTHPETKVQYIQGHDGEEGKWESIDLEKHYPPDATSMIFWLKNRHPDRWRDKQELTGDMNLNIVRKVYDEKEEEES